MGDDQKPTVESKLDKGPDKSVDPQKIAGDLAKQELEFKQAAEVLAADKGHQKDKATVQADLASKRADILVSASAEAGVNYTPGEVPVDQSLASMTATEQADMEALSTQIVEAKLPNPNAAPEQPTAQPATNPPANPGAAPQAAAPAAPTPAPAAEPEKSFGEKIKEFFSKIWEKILAVFSGKKVEEQAAQATAQPAPGDQPAGATIDQSSLQSSNPESLKGPDSTAGLKGKALFDNPQFQARTDQIAAKTGVARADLYAIFKMESGGNPQIQNPTSRATGLIQWMPQYMPKGVKIDELKSMTGLQQLEYVDQHFSRYNGKLKSFSDLYRAVFFPAAIGKPPDYIFGAPDMGFAARVAKQNPGITKDANGYITNASFERHCAKYRPSNSAVPLAVS